MSSWPSVDIIVPARNQAFILPRSLPSLLAQDYAGEWKIILVDDYGEDGTSAVAQRLAATRHQESRLQIVVAPDNVKEWKSGKVAAMNAGLRDSLSDYVLFTDADIEHAPDTLRRLIERSVDGKLDLISLMVKLRCRTLAERLLIPAFVYFFSMLYPFRAVNDPHRALAAAAGGVMLVRQQALKNIGGLLAIKSALIDDCALGAAIKKSGGDLSTAGRIELTLTENVHSLRSYETIRDVREMVARSAFPQLRMSYMLLLGTVLVMMILFFCPILLPFANGFWITAFAMTSWLFMIATYVPMVLFYRLPWTWALTLPLAALIYIAATIDSANLYWQGKGGLWKGRAQA